MKKYFCFIYFYIIKKNRMNSDNENELYNNIDFVQNQENNERTKRKKKKK